MKRLLIVGVLPHCAWLSVLFALVMGTVLASPSLYHFSGTDTLSEIGGIPFYESDGDVRTVCVADRSGNVFPPFISQDSSIGSPDAPHEAAGVPYIAQNSGVSAMCVSSRSGTVLLPFVRIRKAH